MATSFTFKVEAEQVEALAARVDRLADGVSARIGAADAANEIIARWKPRFQHEMNAGLNLSDQYVSSRMRASPATPTGRGTVRAEIVTVGDTTIIGHYPHQQLRAAGTAVRSGRSAGRRPSGVTVEIRKGAPQTEPQWFLMRLRRGTQAGDREGLFVRTTASGGRPVHKYGPSPYSLFRFQIGRLGDEVADDLAATGLAAAASAVERIVR